MRPRRSRPVPALSALRRAAASAVAAAALAMVFVPGSASGQESELLKWRSSGFAGPDPRFAAACVWDTKNDVLVMFGGQDRQGEGFILRSDTWTWKSGGGWKSVEESATWPESRASAATCFDTKRGVMWVLGGVNTTFEGRDDLWTFDAAAPRETPAWKQVEQKGPKPPARFDAAMVYDPAGDRLVLHGGCTAKNLRDAVLSDLWFFDIEKGTWSSKPTTASARYQFASAFDPEAGVLWVHGGFGSGAPPLNDTWTYSLKDDKWTQFDAGPKPERRLHGHAAFWDPEQKAVVVFGGSRGDDAPWADDLWWFDAKAKPRRQWKKVETNNLSKDGPGARAYHAFLWRPSSKSAYVVGGTENLPEDKSWSTEIWSIQLHP